MDENYNYELMNKVCSAKADHNQTTGVSDYKSKQTSLQKLQSMLHNVLFISFIHF